MSRCHQVARPMARCLRHGFATQMAAPSIRPTALRLFSNSASQRDVEPTTSSSSSSPSSSDAVTDAGLITVPATSNGKPQTLKERLLDPNTTTIYWAEKRLSRQGRPPIGSRRRRAAVRQTPDIPFEQLPYHCFQEARKILKEDREEKLDLIKQEYKRIQNVEAVPATQYRGGQNFKNRRLDSLRRHLEELKVQADINDPLVKRKFEDGRADLSKPIYRHLARQRWDSMAYKILVQRLEQFHIVPDVLPEFDPIIDVQLTFRGFRIQPGEVVDSLITESPPNLRLQVFDSSKHLVSIVVMDSDVPDPENDAYTSKLHFVASNVPIDCLTKNVSLNTISKEPVNEQLAVPWLPPTAQEGVPYHRLSIWVLQQPQNKPLDIKRLQKIWQNRRDGFKLTDFMKKHKVYPIGFNIFRSVWDDHTRQVMERHGIPGADIVYRRKRVHTLKPPKKKRGWEAKRQGPGFKHLWKYTKRIAKSSGGT